MQVPVLYEDDTACINSGISSVKLLREKQFKPVFYSSVKNLTTNTNLHRSLGCSLKMANDAIVRGACLLLAFFCAAAGSGLKPLSLLGHMLHM